jgi:hypothetical protein
MPDRDSEVENSLTKIESLGKALLFCGAVCYVVGLLVVNIYLRRFGFSDFSLLRTRFIFAGAICLIPTVIFSIMFFFIGRIIANGITHMYELDVKKSFFSLKMIIVMLAKIVITIGVSIYVFFLFPSPNGFWNSSGVTPWGDYILPIVTSLISIGIIPSILGFKSGVESNCGPGFGNEQHRILRGKIDRIWILLLALTPVLIYGALLYLGVFSSYIYPSTPDLFGGARAKQVQFVLFDDAMDEVLHAGLVMEGELHRTIPLPLLWEGERVYLVAVPGQPNTGWQRSVQIDKSMVAAVLSMPEVRGPFAPEHAISQEEQIPFATPHDSATPTSS